MTAYRMVFGRHILANVSSDYINRKSVNPVAQSNTSMPVDRQENRQDDE